MSQLRSNTKKLFHSILALLILVLAPVQAEEIKTTKIKSVVMQNGALNVSHDSFADLKFKKRIYQSPTRLVIDLLETEMGQKNYSFDVPGSEITKVRVAQFDKTTVRVVCESKTITALEKVQMNNMGQVLSFKFSVSDIIIQDLTVEAGSLRVTADGTITPRTILLDSPTRLVVDLIGSQLKNTAQAQKHTIGEEAATISQFDKSTVRIVFAGPNAHKREVRISNNEKQLLILSDKDKVAVAASVEKSSIAKITSLKIVKSDKNESVFAIEASQKLNYKFLKLHNPERLVIDFLGSEYDPTLSANSLPETPHVSSTRLGLATLGTSVTRLVLDLKDKNLTEEFKDMDLGKTLLIRIVGLADDQIKPDLSALTEGSSKTFVVIDAGHGGYDHGCIYDNHNEKDVTLSIARKVVDELAQSNIKAYMTRDDDSFVALAERVELTNTIRPKLFASIHVNALSTNPKMEGLQTYYYSQDGYKLAEYLHKELLEDVGMPDQRIRKANFWVCKYAKVPAVLLELGFMTNPDERRKLIKDTYQTDLAKAIAKGIIKYIEAND